MKKIFMIILSLALLFILSTVACASEPRYRRQTDRMQSNITLSNPQYSEYLRSSTLHRDRDYSHLRFESSNEEISCVNGDEGDFTEDERNDKTESAEDDEPFIIIMNATRDREGRIQFRSRLENYFNKSR